MGMKCPQCKGSGQVQQYQTVHGMRRQSRQGTVMTVRCPTCQGTGEIHKGSQRKGTQTENRYRWSYSGFLAILIFLIIFVLIVSR